MSVSIPTTTHAASWTDNLIFYAPFTDPANPLTVTTGTGQFSYTRTSAATYIHPTTGLVTVAASNILFYSEEFSSSTTSNLWTASSTTVTADQTTAPDGTLTADLVTVGPAGDGSVVHSINGLATSTGATIQTNQVYTASVYIKANTNTWIALALIGKNGTANTCYFNTTTGAVGTCTANTVAATSSAANGFIRYSVSASMGSGSATVRQKIYLASADNTSTYIGNGSNSVYVWGAQMNSGPVLAPYVKTTTDLAMTARIEAGGYFAEGTRSNLLLWSRDFSNAAWTKTNITSTLTAVGHDGVSNVASVLTAAASNATACQTVTTTATSSGSIDIRRVSGTGSISISLDGGATYAADVSGSLSTSVWYRTVFENQPITNPSFCIKLGTSGDSVIVDYAQLEVSGQPSVMTAAPFVSSRIPTTSTTNTRFIDKLSIPSAGNWSSAEGSLFVIGDVWDTANANKFFVDGGSTPTSVLLHVRSALGNGSGGILGRTTIYDGVECSYGSVNVQPQTSTKMASRWSAISGNKTTTASGATPASCSFDGNMEIISPIVFGDAHAQDGTRTIWGHMKQLRMYNTAISDSMMQLATAGALDNIGTVPDAPTGLATTSVATSTVGLSWAAPVNDGGWPITDYLIQYKIATSSTYTTWAHPASTSTSTLISGLIPNTAYSFAIAAVTSVGSSTATTLIATTTAVIDTSLPTILAATFTSTTTTSIVASSSLVSAGGQNVTVRGFVYGTTSSYGFGTTTESGSWSSGDFSATITGLVCATVYHTAPYAINPYGTSYGSDGTFTTSACSVPVVDNTVTPVETVIMAQRTLTGGSGPAASMSYDQPATAAVAVSPITVAQKQNEQIKSALRTVQKTISQGMNGVYVKSLQQFLNSKGFLVSRGKGPGSVGHETTLFGPATSAALKRLQKRYGIPATGALGPITKAKILELIQ